jgi:ribosomal protein S17E
MSWRGDDDSARIAAANLLDNYREQWNENYKYNKRIGGELDSHIFNLQIGNIAECGEILATLNESVMTTPANRKANQYLAYRIKEYIRHISRRKPKPHLTIKHLRSIQQAYVDAISAHFTHQSQLVSMVLIEVFSNISLISKTSLIPKSLRDDMSDFEDDDFDDEDEQLKYKKPGAIKKIKNKFKK